MTNRDRPRLNITIDSEVKSRLTEVANELDLPVSQLIEAISLEFFDRLEEDPTLGHQIKHELRSLGDEDDGEKSEQIDNILDQMDFSDQGNSGSVIPD